MKRLLSISPSSLPRKTTLKVVLPSGGMTLSSKNELWKCTVFPDIEVISTLLLLFTLYSVTFSRCGTPRGLERDNRCLVSLGRES